MADVFISYSRKDQSFARKLVDALSSRGKIPWLDQYPEPHKGIPAGSDWWDEITSGIETADNFLLIASPRSIVSPYCNAEIALARQYGKPLGFVLYCGRTRKSDTTRKAICKAIKKIPDEKELPNSLMVGVSNLQALANTNWEVLERIQDISFFENDTFDHQTDQLVQALDLDLDWKKMRNQLRRAVKVWEHNRCSEDFLWKGQQLKDVRQMIILLRRCSELSEAEKEFLRPEVEWLEEKLNDAALDHAHRAKISEQLHVIGDTRPGVGLRHDGLPDIVWCPVPSGTVTTKDVEGSFSVNVEPFYIAKYPVTEMQFKSFLDDPDGFSQDKWWERLARSNIPRAISVQSLEGTRWWKGLEDRPPGPGEQSFKFSNHPRETVSWYDAVAFCRWLTAKLPTEVWPAPLSQIPQRQGMRVDESIPTRWGIRLPTEWEWQLAATGGNLTNEYPWGAEWDPGRANTEKSGLRRTIAVGMYPQGASPCGALDMAGNVWEWCLNTYYRLVDVMVSGRYDHTIRGGSWRFDKDSALTMYRTGFADHVRDNDLGFRVVAAFSLVASTSGH